MRPHGRKRECVGNGGNLYYLFEEHVIYVGYSSHWFFSINSRDL